MQQMPLEYVPALPGTSAEPLPGEVTFASAEEQEQRGNELLGAGALLVRLPPPTSHVRGHLGSLLEELVERELARAGAPSPYLAAWTAMPEEANARLSDQLQRAREVGASGLAIALGTLSAIARPTLSTDDSAILRWLAEATTALPLVLLIDDGDMMLTGYAAPRSLVDLLVQVRHDSTPPVMLEEATTIENVVTATVDAAPEPATIEAAVEAAPEPIPSIDVIEAIMTTIQTTPEPMEVEIAVTEPQDATPVACDAPPEPEPAPEPAPVTEPEPVTAEAPTKRADFHSRAFRMAKALLVAEPIPTFEDRSDRETPAPQERIAVEERIESPVSGNTILGVAPPPAEPKHEELTATEEPKHEEPPKREEPTPPARTRRMRTARSAVAGAMEAGPSDAWRTWTLALAAARGAQPLAAFEKLFVESYVPLANAIANGLDDPRAHRAYDEFRRSFERSYTDAFQTFGATNRRPRLVMDSFDIANKQARLANARSAHILVVDSMRYDLGAMIRDALAREAHGAATFGGEMLLWSALPTTTMRQLETLARGMDALRAPAREEPSESLRGRAAEVVRRCRVGSREIHKLDLVPSLLDAAGANAMHELPGIAESVATVIARHITTLVPRTLLFIVGDHGFSVDRRGDVQSGGASPEEVLVPAQQWLVGDVH